MATATTAVLKYLKDVNRPCSVGDVARALADSRHGKAAVQRALEELAESDRALAKTYGKQRVYCAMQNPIDHQVNDATQRATSVDATLGSLMERVERGEGELKRARSELAAFMSAPTTEAARADALRAESEAVAARKRVQTLRNGASPPSPGRRRRIDAEHERCVTAYRRRKRTCMDMIDAILEGYPKTRRELLEELSVETDEDVGFDLSSC